METIPAKSIVTRTKSAAWFGTRYNMNIYRGCCHGCIYCDSRSDCYGIENFDRVRAKENALGIIRDELRRKVQRGVIGTGAMSDPYNPFEAETQLTRHALELISAYGFGVSIATKGTLVTRDIDVLREVAQNAPVIVKLTITCADDALARRIEPGAPPSSARFEALRALSDAGIYAGVLLMPMLPWISDDRENINAVAAMAGASGARFLYPGSLTLRTGQREPFYAALDRSFPGLRERYETRFGTRYVASSPRARTLAGDLADACRQNGLLSRMLDITRGYQRGYEIEQLSLF